MDCKEALGSLPAHIDFELGIRDEMELEAHFAICDGCRSQLERLSALHAATSSHATQHKAPPDLHPRVMASLPDRGVTPAVSASKWPRWSWLNWGSALITASAVAWSVGLTVMRPSADELLVDELVSSHVRARLTGHLTDVTSTDQHTVKPWFGGKLDFSPPVQDLAAEGFALTGARMDYIDHRSVAVMVYAHRLHTLDLFVRPSGSVAWHGTVKQQSLSQQGYQIVSWSHKGMEFWAISDVNHDELEQFRAALLSSKSQALSSNDRG